MLELLSPEEIRTRLEDLPGWECEDRSLIKRFRFPTYMDGIRFVEATALEAEGMDHHPDLLVRFAEVTVFLSTHSLGGVTFRDTDLAARIERVAPSCAAIAD